MKSQNNLKQILLLFAIFFAVSILACERKLTEMPPVDALARAEKNLAESPSFENHVNLGIEYANRGLRDKTLAIYQKALAMSPKSPLAWNNVCAELNVQNRPLEAVVFCAKAVELEPSFALAAKNLELTQARITADKKASAHTK